MISIARLNAGEGHKGKARKLPDFTSPADDSISYKDVHKRVKRLEELRLIKTIEKAKRIQKQKRKVIRYRVTSQGLFQCLLGPRSAKWIPYLEIELPLLYKDEMIFQTLIYRYFQEDTVKEILSIFGDKFFNNYLRNCCEGILRVADEIPLLEEHEGLKKMWQFYYPQKQIIHRQLMIDMNLDFLESQIDYLINNELKNLIHQIVSKSADDEYKDKFPSRVLRDDEQLYRSVDKLKNEFNDGVRTLFNL